LDIDIDRILNTYNPEVFMALMAQGKMSEAFDYGERHGIDFGRIVWTSISTEMRNGKPVTTATTACIRHSDCGQTIEVTLFGTADALPLFKNRVPKHRITRECPVEIDRQRAVKRENVARWREANREKARQQTREAVARHRAKAKSK
jgi:hypothetical protein